MSCDQSLIFNVGILLVDLVEFTACLSSEKELPVQVPLDFTRTILVLSFPFSATWLLQSGPQVIDQLHQSSLQRIIIPVLLATSFCCLRFLSTRSVKTTPMIKARHTAMRAQLPGVCSTI